MRPRRPLKRPRNRGGHGGWSTGTVKGQYRFSNYPATHRRRSRRWTHRVTGTRVVKYLRGRNSQTNPLVGPQWLPTELVRADPPSNNSRPKSITLVLNNRVKTAGVSNISPKSVMQTEKGTLYKHMLTHLFLRNFILTPTSKTKELSNLSLSGNHTIYQFVGLPNKREPPSNCNLTE